jgi:hypothetical protein
VPCQKAFTVEAAMRKRTKDSGKIMSTDGSYFVFNMQQTSMGIPSSCIRILLSVAATLVACEAHASEIISLQESVLYPGMIQFPREMGLSNAGASVLGPWQAAWCWLGASSVARNPGNQSLLLRQTGAKAAAKVS